MLSILKKIIAFSNEEKRNLIKGILWGLLIAVFRMAHIGAIALALNSIINKTVSFATIWQVLALMLIGLVGSVAGNFNSTMNLTQAGYTISANSRIRIADHLKNMSMGYFNANNLGKITSVATNSADQINEILTRSLMLLSVGVFMSAIITVSMFCLDYRLGFVCLFGIILFFVILEKQQKRNLSISKTVISGQQELVNTILEYVQGIAVVKSYNLIGSSNKKVKAGINKSKENQIKLERTFIPNMILQTFVFKVVSFLMIYLSIRFYINGSMDLFTAIMMSICSFLIFADLESAGMFTSLLRMIELSINEIKSILNSPVMDENSKDVKVQNYDIEIENISFSYDKKKIIDNLSLNIKQNSTLAIVGSSGGGKTTLCNLITRFWDTDSGSIKLGGQNIKDIKLDELLSSFTMVFQNVYLFNDTIANNIKFGKPNATQKEIEEVCKKACCHDFIMNLPLGYDTIVGEGGSTISGGEKQRISIARAMIKNSPIVILDEATANVDPENEYQLQLAIKELTKSKTVIMIAHRLKTVKTADNIIVLENGKIVESGNHEELMAKGCSYASFIRMREKAIGWKLGGKF